MTKQTSSIWYRILQLIYHPTLPIKSFSTAAEHCLCWESQAEGTSQTYQSCIQHYRYPSKPSFLTVKKKFSETFSTEYSNSQPKRHHQKISMTSISTLIASYPSIILKHSGSLCRSKPEFRCSLRYRATPVEFFS